MVQLECCGDVGVYYWYRVVIGVSVDQGCDRDSSHDFAKMVSLCLRWVYNLLPHLNDGDYDQKIKMV